MNADINYSNQLITKIKKDNDFVCLDTKFIRNLRLEKSFFVDQYVQNFLNSLILTYCTNGHACFYMNKSFEFLFINEMNK